MHGENPPPRRNGLPVSHWGSRQGTYIFATGSTESQGSQGTGFASPMATWTAL